MLDEMQVEQARIDRQYADKMAGIAARQIAFAHSAVCRGIAGLALSGSTAPELVALRDKLAALLPAEYLAKLPECDR